MAKIATVCVLLGGLAGAAASAQEKTPSPALLVLHKGENAMAIVDPASGKVAGRVPTGQDPHELVVSDDGKLAIGSNYAGPGPRGGQQPLRDRHRREEGVASGRPGSAPSPARAVVP